MSQQPSIRSMILVPAIVTLGVTLARLIGELSSGSAALFSREAGGAAAVVGIVWLIPVFGAWFAWTLARAGHGPARLGAALGWTVLALAAVPLTGALAGVFGISAQSPTGFALFVVAALVGIGIAFRAWPALARTLLAYGVAARIPVVVVMLFAMLGRWGTHYDALPPGFPADLGPVTTWLLIGALPQLTIWIWFTLALGGLCGVAAAFVAGRSRGAAAV